MPLRTIFAFAAFALIAPAAAQDAAQPPAATAPVKEKKICKRQVATGSIMGRATCHTKTEWDAISKRDQSDADRFRTSIGPGPAAGSQRP